MSKRIAIVGAGAVGGYVGAHLTAGGHDVTLIDTWPEHVEVLKANGMEIYGMTPEERMTVKVNAMHLTEVQNLAKQKPIDIAFISVKSYDTVWATQMIGQYLSASGTNPGISAAAMPSGPTSRRSTSANRPAGSPSGPRRSPTS